MNTGSNTQATSVESPPSPGSMRDKMAFLRSWVKAPGLTGAVWPSSQYLARVITAELGSTGAKRVAELGPGTGPVTSGIQRRLANTGGEHVAVELNPDLARRLKNRFPDVDVTCDSATELPKILADRGISAVDAVLSGLPFAAFPVELQRDVLDAVVASLEPEHGVFSTFTYMGAFSMPAGRRFRSLLVERFSHMKVSSLVLRNLPPAYVVVARGPKSKQ